MRALDDSPKTVEHIRRAAVAGAAGGGTVGLMTGLLLGQTLVTSVAVVAAGLIGALVSATLAVRFGIVEWEPGPGHTYVGAQTPDDDLR
jgi:hypothetical protein